MILTDYYKMQELKALKSHRFDCVASTGEYEPFEIMAQRSRVKRFFFYYNGVPDTFSVNAQRKADRAITNGDNISSVYIPDLETPLKGYGDTKGTNDGLLLLFSEDYKQVEVFVARGYKNNIKSLCNLFLDGELNEELNEMRNRATATNI
ncbi:hypothetical protein LJB92_03920 [Bacteroidales bacterium OttesenSCG-928-M06]|nr:hypothetical protein [Bacteroidales bacterium OttesenSCG-928-M06]